MDNNVSFVLFFAAWFVFSLLISRSLSTYSGKGKYLPINNRAWSIILIDGTRLEDGRSRIRGEHRHKMSLHGFVFYILNILIFLSFGIFLALPPMPCRHFKLFTVNADTLNYAIPAYALLLIILAEIITYIIFTAIGFCKHKYKLYLKIIMVGVLSLIVLVACLCAALMLFGIHLNILL